MSTTDLLEEIEAAMVREYLAIQSATDEHDRVHHEARFTTLCLCAQELMDRSS